MQLKNTLTRYGALAQLFHWVIVVLIITQFVLALRAEGLSPIKKIGVLGTHKSIGITIPMLGWLMSSARAFSVSWFGLVQLPDLIEPNRATFERLKDWHEAMAFTLAA